MKNLYLSILLVGIVFTFLSLLTGIGFETAITILFFTVYIVCVIRLIEEWRFFTNYNAPPASSLFLILISILGLTASYTSRLATIGSEPLFRQSVISLSVDVSFLGIFPAELFTNIFSILFGLFWYISLFILMKRYHSGRYPGVFINRKLFPRFTIIFVNIILILLLVVVWSQSGQIELTEFLWVILTIVLMLQYYVFKITLVPVRIVSIPFRSERKRRRINQSSYSSTPQPRLIIPSSQSTNRSGNRITTTPSVARENSQIRDYSTSSTSPRPLSTPRRSNSLQTNPRRSSTNMSVLPGREIGQINQKNKISPSHLPLILPKAKNLSQDDFRCIFCYELPVENNKNVIICSNCHHPSHEEEYLQWKSNSDICSFCNARTSSNKIIRLSGKNYSKLIKLALKK